VPTPTGHDDLEPVETGSRAERWFSVRIEYERFGILKAMSRTIRELFIALFTLGLLLGEWDPKRFCDVLVVRNDTGEVVASFSYDHLGEADTHVRVLREELETKQVFDFCRTLGVGIDAVVGVGTDRTAHTGVEWTQIWRKQRHTQAQS
jgi:hypothetical protein